MCTYYSYLYVKMSSTFGLLLTSNQHTEAIGNPGSAGLYAGNSHAI
jgi:hypothetical protein